MSSNGGYRAGVHREALQWPLLIELCWLFPATHLHIVMVSPSLPDSLPQQGRWVRRYQDLLLGHY